MLKVAGTGDNEQITAMLVEALERSGYIKALTAESAKAKVRRLGAAAEPQRPRCPGGAGDAAADSVEAGRLGGPVTHGAA